MSTFQKKRGIVYLFEMGDTFQSSLSRPEVISRNVCMHSRSPAEGVPIFLVKAIQLKSIKVKEVVWLVSLMYYYI